MAYDHQVNTELTVEEVLNVPSTIDPTKLYFVTGEATYHRPVRSPDGTLRTVPLPMAEEYVYDKRDVLDLLHPHFIIARSSVLGVGSVTYGTNIGGVTWAIPVTTLGITSSGVTLRLPAVAPTRWIGVLAEGIRTIGGADVVQGSRFIPWGGFAGHTGTMDEGSAPVITHNPDSGAHHAVVLETTTPIGSQTGAGTWTLHLAGAGTIQAANTRVRLRAVAV